MRGESFFPLLFFSVCCRGRPVELTHRSRFTTQGFGVGYLDELGFKREGVFFLLHDDNHNHNHNQNHNLIALRTLSSPSSTKSFPFAFRHQPHRIDFGASDETESVGKQGGVVVRPCRRVGM